MDNEELKNLKDVMGITHQTLDDIQFDLYHYGEHKAGRIVADASAHLKEAIDLMNKEILKRTTESTRAR